MSSRNTFRTEALPIGRWLSLVRPTIPTGVANLIIIGCVHRCIGHAANLIGTPNLYGIVLHGHRSGPSTVSAPINHSATRQQHYGRSGTGRLNFQQHPRAAPPTIHKNSSTYNKSEEHT